MPSAPKRPVGLSPERTEAINQRLKLGYVGDPSMTAAPSEAPGFKHIRFAGEHTDEHGVKSSRVQSFLDPEKHLEFITKHDLSVDAKNPHTLEKLSTSETMQKKTWEAMQPKGAVHAEGLEQGQPIHGAGLHESIVERGEPVKNPLHQIFNPQRYPLAGGRTMQGQGNHRLVMAAMAQKQARESGDPNWARPVPYNTFYSAEESRKAEAVGEDQQRVMSAREAVEAYKAEKALKAAPQQQQQQQQQAPPPAPEPPKKRRFLRRG